jgi:TDG/mug DNA glycosylase family protein
MVTQRLKKPGLPDYIPDNCRILFVGLNPGMRSAEVGHHFAGYTNKFWRLMADAGFLPPGTGFANDRNLPEYALGITNLVGRPTRGVSDLQPQDFADGRRTFLRKIRKHRPQTIAAVGLMVFREMVQTRRAVQCGLQAEKIEGIPIFVVPNPSGRNAHFTYQEMLRHFVSLREWTRKQ